MSVGTVRFCLHSFLLLFLFVSTPNLTSGRVPPRQVRVEGLEVGDSRHFSSLHFWNQMVLVERLFEKKYQRWVNHGDGHLIQSVGDAEWAEFRLWLVIDPFSHSICSMAVFDSPRHLDNGRSECSCCMGPSCPMGTRLTLADDGDGGCSANIH